MERKPTEEVVEEEEYYDEEEGTVQSMTHEAATNFELQRLQQLLESNQVIPEVIILKDEFGVPQEYEVLVESEEFDTSYLGSSQGSQTRRSVKLKLRKSHESIVDSEGNRQKIKVVSEFDIPSDASCEYYEEVIEESEEESDS